MRPTLLGVGWGRSDIGINRRERKPDGRMSFNPSHLTEIQSNDVLITMGSSENQGRLAEAARG